MHRSLWKLHVTLVEYLEQMCLKDRRASAALMLFLHISKWQKSLCKKSTPCKGRLKTRTPLDHNEGTSTTLLVQYIQLQSMQIYSYLNAHMRVHTGIENIANLLSVVLGRSISTLGSGDGTEDSSSSSTFVSVTFSYKHNIKDIL
jgi:hypothetical protein